MNQQSEGRTEHTPGPWMHVDDTIIAAHVGIIARVPNHPENGQNWQNDARLIAAAPEMHAALIAAEEMLGWCVHEHYAPDNTKEKAALELVRAALTNTGETA